MPPFLTKQMEVELKIQINFYIFQTQCKYNILFAIDIIGKTTHFET